MQFVKYNVLKYIWISISYIILNSWLLLYEKLNII